MKQKTAKGDFIQVMMKHGADESLTSDIIAFLLEAFSDHKFFHVT